MNWGKVRFEELYFSPSRNGIYKSADSHGSGIKIVNMGEIFAYDFIGNQEMQRISLSKEEYERFGLQNGDLLFARRSLVESGAGKTSIVVEMNEPTTFESSIIRVRLDQEKCVPLFYHYWMRSLAGRTAIGALVTGTNVKGIRGTALKDIIVDYPDYTVQARIADILKNYDNLIENNQKQIKLLEEAAQRLYKEWFVDLRFPGYEDTPIIDGVPEGWYISNIGSLCSRVNAGGTPNRCNKNYWYDPTIKWFKTGELQDSWLIDSDEMISQEGLDGSSAKIFPKNTILMAIYASPTLGRLGILTSNSACNQAALCLLADELKISWQWLYCKLYELRDDFNAVAKGAGQQNISADTVKKKEVIVPTKRIIDEFNYLVAPMFEKRLNLQKQIKYLSHTRDRLLPKLMSGEIEV